MPLIHCPECDAQMSITAAKCQSCGAKPDATARKVVLWIGLLLIVGGLIWAYATWPDNPYMGVSLFTVLGLVAAFGGLVTVLWSRFMRRWRATD